MSRIAVLGATGRVAPANSYATAVRLKDRGNLLRDRYLQAVRELYPSRSQLPAEDQRCCR